jgi:hypothetical protein
VVSSSSHPIAVGIAERAMRGVGTAFGIPTRAGPHPCDRVAQLRAARPAELGSRRRCELLDADVHQLAAPGAVPPCVVASLPRRRVGRHRGPHAGGLVRARQARMYQLVREHDVVRERRWRSRSSSRAPSLMRSRSGSPRWRRQCAGEPPLGPTRSVSAAGIALDARESKMLEEALRRVSRSSPKSA